MANRNVEAYAAAQTPLCVRNDTIPESLFQEYGVNRGLRDVNGVGVLTGLTNISKIVSFRHDGGKWEPCEGQLWYRGYNVKDLIDGLGPDEFGFEKISYLLLFGDLPSQEELAEFTGVLSDCRTLPTNFTRDVIMKAPSKDIMNSMTRSVLTLASYDSQVNGDLGNSIRQCIRLISEFPMLAVYGYHAYNHYENDESMYIHRPDPNLSTAENILRMLRHDRSYTKLEAKALDIALILHMEHGGGNNSTFTTRVVTSSGSDTYSTIAAALSSLKGPRHGGANIKVMEMIQDLKNNLSDWTDPGQTSEYLKKILRKEAFDHSGLIYGMGHAVYSISDPRAADSALLRQPAGGGEGPPRRPDHVPQHRGGWPPSSSPRTAPSTRASAPTSTCTAASSTTCWASPWSSTPPCSPSPASWAGAPTASRSWCA